MKTVSITNPYFSICQTLECGQVFRYKKNQQSYVVFSQDKKCELTQNGDTVTLKSDDIDYFLHYFDLDTDYENITKTLSQFDELKEAIQFGKGIRILRQNLIETVISFIISQNNNIARIQKIIEKLCSRCGRNMGDYYAFPTIESLLILSEDDYKEMGLGYRAQYLYSAVRAIKDGALDSIQSESDAKARERLLRIKGIGPKVADCIMLFGLTRTSAYPVDTWIFKANATKTLDTPKKVEQYFTDRYSQFSGYAQQYVFYHARSNKIAK